MIIPKGITSLRLLTEREIQRTLCILLYLLENCYFSKFLPLNRAGLLPTDSTFQTRYLPRLYSLT